MTTRQANLLQKNNLQNSSLSVLSAAEQVNHQIKDMVNNLPQTNPNFRLFTKNTQNNSTFEIRSQN